MHLGSFLIIIILKNLEHVCVQNKDKTIRLRKGGGGGGLIRKKQTYLIHMVNGWEPNILKGKELIRKWQIKNWKTCNYSDDGYIGTCLGGMIIGSYIILPYKNRFYLVESIFKVIELLLFFLIWSFFPFLEVITYFSSLSSFNSNMLLLHPCFSCFIFHFLTLFALSFY